MILYLKNIFMLPVLMVIGWLGYFLMMSLYISPIFIPDTNKFLADPLLIVSFMPGAGIGMCLLAPVSFICRLCRGKPFRERNILIILGCFSVAGFFANIAVYQYVIKPKEMIICPREFGYKKNLMRFYVTDLSLCKSD